MRKIFFSLVLVFSLSTGVFATPATNHINWESERILPPRQSAPLQTNPEQPVIDNPSPTPQKNPKLQQAGSSGGAQHTKQQTNASQIAALRKKLSSANFLTKVEQATLDAQNVERERLNLAPLVYDSDLQTAARQRSYELYKSDTFVHKRPDGRAWYTVLQIDVPYSFKEAGENLCTTEYNDPTLRLAYDGDFWTEEWINSPPHYTAMINPTYTNAGIGIYLAKKNGITYAYATTLYALPSN